MKTLFTFIIALALSSGVFSQQLDTNQLAQDAWINYWPATQPFTANGGNWVYENDFRSHPFYPFLIVGPGHYIHCQDCYYYPVDPVRGTGLKLNTAVRPVRT